MLVRAPGGKATRVSHPVSLADVTPTLLRAAGLAIPEGLYGRALDADHDPGRAIYSEVFSHTYQWRSVRRGSQKWLVFVRHGMASEGATSAADDDRAGSEPALTRYRYFDLKVDPGELRPMGWSNRTSREVLALRNLIHSDPAVRNRIKPKGYMLRAPKVAPGVDEKTLERLRSLGYVQ